jgi:hypothetical protein
MKKRRLFMLGFFLLTLYCGLYLYVRSNHWIVHRSGFAFGNTDNHRVVLGDVVTTQRHIAYLVFAPLRYAETGYWYVRYPKSEPWPYFETSTPAESNP